MHSGLFDKNVFSLVRVLFIYIGKKHFLQLMRKDKNGHNRRTFCITWNAKGERHHKNIRYNQHYCVLPQNRRRKKRIS